MATVTTNARQPRYLKDLNDSLAAVNTELEALAAGSDPAQAKMTFGTGLATVATLGVAVKLVSTTAAAGDSNLWTVGVDNTLTATFLGTRTVNVRGLFSVDVASGTDNCTLHVYVGGASAYETPAQSVTAATAVLYEIDVMLDVANGEAIEIYAENEDTTENVDTATFVERVDTTPSHGYVTLSA